MKFKIRTFGIAGDLLGGKQVVLEVNGNTVADLRHHLSTQYPKLNDLRSLMIAVNLKYAGDAVELKETDEIALIPPVSGG